MCLDLLNQFAAERTPATMFAAVAAAAHMADWHYRFQLGKKYDPQVHGPEFSAIFPEWEVLRTLANGTKHAKMLSVTDEEGAWGHRDGFHHLYDRGRAFPCIDVEGEPRSVIALCRNFLAAYMRSLGFHNETDLRAAVANYR